jgi:signal transduction histidine kinase
MIRADLRRVPSRLDRIAHACLSEAEESLRESSLTVTEQLNELPDYPLDPERMKEAVGSLLSESIRRAGSGARLRVTVKGGRHAIMVSAKAPGEGIDPDDAPLAVPARAAEIAEAHGGRAWANGRPGRGITFYLTLPVPPIDV